MCGARTRQEETLRGVTSLLPGLSFLARLDHKCSTRAARTLLLPAVSGRQQRSCRRTETQDDHGESRSVPPFKHECSDSVQVVVSCSAVIQAV